MSCAPKYSTVYSCLWPFKLTFLFFFMPPVFSLTRSESSFSTGVLGSSAWRSLEKKAKWPWARLTLRPTNTPSRPRTTPVQAAFRWAPFQGSPRSPPRQTATWTFSSATTPWAQTTLPSHQALIQDWWCVAVAAVGEGTTRTAPPSLTSTRTKRGLCCWNRFQKFLTSWRKFSTSQGASGTKMRARKSAASGNLRPLSWIGYVWWRSRCSPSSAPSPYSCQLPISLRRYPRTSHKATSLLHWNANKKKSNR